MHAPMDEAIGEPLNLLPGLDEQAAVGDADGHAPAVLQPHRQPREARLAVDRQKVEVVVVACVAGPCRTIPLQINTWTAQSCHIRRLLLSSSIRNPLNASLKSYNLPQKLWRSAQHERLSGGWEQQ